MKVKRLLERKQKLNEELVLAGQQIIKVGKAIEQKGLQHFIDSGELGKPATLPLEKLKKRCEYLRNMASQLNKEIARAREIEREVEIDQAQKRLDQNLKEHDRYNKQGYDMKLTIEKLKVRARTLNEEELMLRQELKAVQRADHTETLKLTKEGIEIEEFLAKFYVANPEELRKLVKETRQGNRALLTSTGVRPVGLKRMDVFLGFQLTLDKNSGEILGKKPITRTVEGMMSAKAQIQEVI